MERTELMLSLEDHKAAFTEVSFLLEILVCAIGDVVNKAAPSLGAHAGRQAAKKFPVHLMDPTAAEAAGTVARRLSAGFGIACTGEGSGFSLTVDRCAIRNVCAERKLQPGGDLCRMFHYYLAGMVTELLSGRQVRVGEAIVGDKCVVRMECR